MPVQQTELPPELKIRVTERIVSRLSPVAPLPSNGVLVSWLLLLELVAVSGGVLWLHFKGWEALAPSQALAVFSLLASSILLIATVAVGQMIPGARLRIAPAAAIPAVFFAMLAAILLLFPFQPSAQFAAPGLPCLLRGLLVSAVAAALLFSLVRQSAWLSPVRLGAATGCLSGLAGLTVLEIYCPLLDRAHIGVWHLGAAITATLAGAAVGALIVRHRNIRVSSFE